MSVGPVTVSEHVVDVDVLVMELHPVTVNQLPALKLYVPVVSVKVRGAVN
jgi:hypothetical protein